MATIEKFEKMEIWQKARLICQAIFERRKKNKP